MRVKGVGELELAQGDSWVQQAMEAMMEQPGFHLFPLRLEIGQVIRTDKWKMEAAIFHRSEEPQIAFQPERNEELVFTSPDYLELPLAIQEGFRRYVSATNNSLMYVWAHPQILELLLRLESPVLRPGRLLEATANKLSKHILAAAKADPATLNRLHSTGSKDIIKDLYYKGDGEFNVTVGGRELVIICTKEETLADDECETTVCAKCGAKSFLDHWSISHVADYWSKKRVVLEPEVRTALYRKVEAVITEDESSCPYCISTEVEEDYLLAADVDFASDD